jgi:DNA-binding PadR family transcriptional regulator
MAPFPSAHGRYGARMAPPLPDLSLSDWAVLGVVTDVGPTHGWTVVRELAGDGPLGQIWTVTRPLVYRSLATLLDAGLIETCGEEPGRGGPRRTIVRPTRAGRAVLRRWLAAPVDHVRDVRTALLLKVAFLVRAGEPATGLVRRQLDALAPVFESVHARVPRDGGVEAVLVRWRREQTLAVQRFLTALAGAE